VSRIIRSYKDHMITPKQCRMARAAVGWTTRQLAAASEVGEATVKRFERGVVDPNRSTNTAIQRAFEGAGVLFIPENGGGAGVRLRDRESPAPTEEAV
jgi:ribosome-binding protein aMBF1 (putative translation factor)